MNNRKITIAVLAVSATLVIISVSLFGFSTSSFSTILPNYPDHAVRLHSVDFFAGQEEPEFEGKLSKGKFLVASRNLLDPRFQQTVVLLLRYDQSGALGVIINRPSELSIAEALDKPEFKKRKDSVYFGGPVEGDRMLLLVRAKDRPDEAELILKNVYVSGSMVVLTRIVDKPKEGEAFRLYAGYAGWAAGQLEMELTRGDWYVVEADARTIFDMNPEKVWPEMIRRGSAIQVKTTGDLMDRS